MTPLRHWVSPVSGARWPVAWRLQSPAGDMQLEAAFDAQEVDARFSNTPGTGVVYWEGAALLRDSANRPLGAGYLELTGYAGRPPML
jgi:predicted secreted hydrolase